MLPCHGRWMHFFCEGVAILVGKMLCSGAVISGGHFVLTRSSNVVSDRPSGRPWRLVPREGCMNYLAS